MTGKGSMRRPGSNAMYREGWMRIFSREQADDVIAAGGSVRITATQGEEEIIEVKDPRRPRCKHLRVGSILLHCMIHVAFTAPGGTIDECAECTDYEPED